MILWRKTSVGSVNFLAEKEMSKQVKQVVDPDSPLLGLAGETTSPLSLVNINELSALTNAVVDERGQISIRQGTNLSSVYNTNSESQREGFNFYLASAFNSQICIAKVGTSFVIAQEVNDSYVTLSTKLSVLKPELADRKGQFSHIFDKNLLTFIWLEASSQPIFFTVRLDSIRCVAVTGATTATLLMPNAPVDNVLAASNFSLRDNSGLFKAMTNVVQVGTSVFIEAAGISLTTGANYSALSCFFLRGCDANVYPGNTIYQSAIRRNSVALDVNVSIPNELTGVFLKDESPPNIDAKPYNVFRQSVLPLTEAAKVTNKQPATEDQWDLSDGAFRPGQLSVRTDSTLAFGALEAGGNVVRVHINRQREVQLNNKVTVPQASINCYADKVLISPQYYDINNTLTVGNPSFFTVNLTQATVLELVLLTNTTNYVSVDNRLVDYSVSRPVINDTIIVPVYGMSQFANVVNQDYPSLSTALGNRLYFASERNNYVVGSNSNWTYRGLAFNNLQVDTNEFASTATIHVKLQSDINGLSKAGSSLIAATKEGIFRLFSQSGTPSADSLSVRKVSDKVVSQQTMLSVDYRLFIVDDRSVWQINYNRDSDDLNTENICPQLTSLLKTYLAHTIAYSTHYNSLLLSFNSSFIYVLNLDNGTLSRFAVQAGGKHRLYQTYDGVVLPLNGDGLARLAMLSFGDYVNDFQNNTIPGLTFLAEGRQVVVTELPTDVTDKFIQTDLSLAGTVTGLSLAALPNSVKVTGSSSLVVTETLPNSPLPITGYEVKAYVKGILQGVINKAVRTASLTTLVHTPNTQQASATVSVIPVRREDDYRAVQTTEFDLGNQPSNVGLGLVNYIYKRQPRGSSGVTRLDMRLFGLGAGCQYNITLKNCSLLGLQLTSNVKGKRSWTN